ncbi:MAG: FAD-binding protein, partial [Pseudomonadota bacterium]
MKDEAHIADLMAQFPAMQRDVPLAKYMWFRVGGAAKLFLPVQNLEDLQKLLTRNLGRLPVLVVGLGSNLLLCDDGFPGIVVRLVGAFRNVSAKGNQVIAQGGALDSQIAKTAMQSGLSGFEFLIGVPGTIGGGVRMNAGAYDYCVADRVLSL